MALHDTDIGQRHNLPNCPDQGHQLGRIGCPREPLRPGRDDTKPRLGAKARWKIVASDSHLAPVRGETMLLSRLKPNTMVQHVQFRPEYLWTSKNENAKCQNECLE